ncbi:ABC transporter substrate-binding protein [Vibrio algivorus]|uniref:Sugar ABC transporter substrate-binding protein n=1 Tax=Vibrio algivorus TaxID=1667024 RepID=A0ABQ6ERJ4_9VIBR|nr:ABC transporter substrate-binding protein [Vibrio algivorus]GLT15346.1 sugar ABC transporter substrate-binding protein [Vibrio algivorus]
MKLKKLSLYCGLALSFSSPTYADITTLEVSSWKGAGAEVANFPTIIERFEKANPDIKIKLNYMARNDMVTSIPARFQARNPPDVVMVDREFIQHWGGNGQLIPLNDQPFLNRIKPELIPYLGIDDKTYYAMLQISGMGVFVNNTLFKEAGISQYPQTIEELTQACTKLDSHGVQPMLLAANNGGWTPFIYFLAMGLANNDKPDHTLINDLMSGKKKFSETQSLKNAFEAFRKMIDAKCFDPKISAGTDPWSVALTSFQSGKVAMLPQGLWNIGPFQKDQLPENFSLHPFPSINGTKAISLDYNGPGWAIPKDAKHKEAAKKWIDYWMHDKNLSLYVKADTSISTLKNGTSGIPPLAKPYEDARDAGNFVTFPVGTLSVELGADMPNDITSFMLNPKQDYMKIMQRWDKMVEDK